MKITKSELRQRCIDNETAIATLESLLKEHGITRKQEPKPKQLDQSVFDGLDEKWRFAAVDKSGKGWVYTGQPVRDGVYWLVTEQVGSSVGTGYDATNWQNSLIERDKVELTGSDLCRAMLERGDRYVMCAVDDGADVISGVYEDGSLVSINDAYKVAIPINNQGEPLTATDVGL